MCWSWQVSLGSTLAEWAGILYLLRRNIRKDRWHAAIMLPIAVQEFLQFIVWSIVDLSAGDRARWECDFRNKVLFFFILITVAAIPVVVSLYAWRNYCNPKLYTRGQKSILGVVFGLAVLWYFVGIVCDQSIKIFTATLDDICVRPAGPRSPGVASCAQCIFVGLNGHQVWPLKPNDYAKAWLIYGGYNILIVLPLLLARPRFVPLSCVLVFFATYIPARVFLQRDFEYLSVWCWAGGAFLLLFLALPTLESRWTRSGVSQKQKAKRLQH